MRKWIHIIILVGIFCLAFFLRFYNLSTIPPGIHGDEAEFGLIEQKINNESYDNFFSVGDSNSIFAFPVLGYWTQGLSIRIFGENILGIRSSSAFIGTVTVILFFFLTKLFFNNIIISYVLTFALATSHWHIAYSRMAINNIWCPFFMVIVFFYLLKGFHTGKAAQFILAGIFMGLSLYFPQANKVIPIIVLLYSLFYIIKNYRSLKQNGTNVFLLLISSVILFLPQLVYFLQNPSIFTGRIDTVSIFNHLPEYYERYHVSDILGVLFWQLINTLKVFNFGGDIGFYFYGYQGGLLAPIVGVLAVIGLFLSLIKIRKDKYLFFLIWLLAIVILGGTITVDAPSSQRLLGLIPVLFLFAGVTLEQLMKYKIQYLKTILVILFIINGIWDYKIYFKDYINSQAGWAQREPATQIAYYLKSLGPEWKVYMLRENTWLYFHHGTIRFLNPNLEGADVDKSEDQIPISQSTEKNIVYIMPPNSPSISRMKLFYPKGTERNFVNPIDNTSSFESYEIKNVDLYQ